MRLEILDGFRGWFLLFMMIAHAAAALGAPLGAYTHHSIGWVEDAQGFVFVSGLVVGLVYARRLVRKGEDAMREGIRARIVKIYGWQASLIALFLLTALLCVSLTGEAPRILAPYAEEPVVFTTLSLLLVGSSMHMGILPMYIFFLLATPAILRALRRGHGAAVAVASVLFWLLAQTHVVNNLQYPVEAWLARAGHPANIGIYFDILAWQVLYVAGLWAGWLMAAGRLDLDRLKDPALIPAAAVGLAGFIALALFDRAVDLGWLGREYSQAFNAANDRAVLSPIHAIAFFLDLFLVAWLLVAGPVSRSRIVAAAAAGLEWLMTRPLLTLLGRHSLDVFVVHLVAVYLIEIWVEDHSLAPTTANLVLLASLAPLYAVAWVKDAPARRARGEAALSAA